MTHQPFVDCIAQYQDKKPILLVGNGFSIDWSREVFRYQAILGQADETDAFAVASEYARTVFNILNDTSDFEVVVKALKTSSILTEHYQCTDTATVQKMKSDVAHVQNILVETIARHHPENSLAITDEQSEFCKLFLMHFSKIYTINYDLLLYWVINKHLDEIPFMDRFEDPVAGTLEEGEEYYEEDYVKWSLGNESNATLFYLHGGLCSFIFEVQRLS